MKRLNLNRLQWACLLAGISIVLLLMLLRWLVYLQHVDQSLNLHEPYLLEVRPGGNLIRILNQLETEAVLQSALDLRIYTRLHLGSPRLNAGEYLLDPGLSGKDLIHKLVNGEVNYYQVQILEGWTLQQALRAIQTHPAVIQKLADVAQLQDLLGADLYPEGLLFPDTYNFFQGTTDIELINQAASQMQKVLDEAWAGRDSGLPYNSAYEALIMASIVEKETGLASERSRIAGVFVSRLRQNMRLQTDPSVIYGLGADFDGNLTRTGLQTDSPWNTYTRAGLPLTPIALPGRAAIMASVHPEESQYLYFVATGDGSHFFSATLEEHNAAVRKFQLSENGP